MPAAKKRRLGEIQEETDALRAQLVTAEAAFQAALRGEAEARAELASLQAQVKEAANAVQAAQDEAAHAKMLESLRAEQYLVIARRAAGAVSRFVGEAPALPCAHGDGGYLNFFGKVVEALETGVSRVDEDNASSARDLLDLALTRVFSNLRRHVPELDLPRVMEPVPEELQRPLRDKTRPHMESLVERFIQEPLPDEGDDSGAAAGDGLGGDSGSSA